MAHSPTGWLPDSGPEGACPCVAMRGCDGKWEEGGGRRSEKEWKGEEGPKKGVKRGRGTVATVFLWDTNLTVQVIGAWAADESIYLSDPIHSTESSCYCGCS